MKFYTLRTKQTLPIDITTAWNFFSSPKNLKEITPEHLSFEVTSEYLPEKMLPGTIITYTVKPLLGIPLNWMTEITHIEENKFFVDEQRFGPYKLWHHRHFFNEVTGGVEMEDIVDYMLPFGIFGRIAHWMIVRRQLEGIFSYRFAKLKQKFG